MKTAIATQSNSLPTRITLLLASMLTVMASATIAPSLPAMLKHFETVPNSAYWVRLVLTLPALFIAISAPILGILVDRLGRKPLLFTALIVYGVAGSSGLWLTSLDTIIIGRALLGISVAGITISSTALIADYYVGAARGKFLGLQAAFSSLGGVVFLSLGGWLADTGWRNPFLIYFTALLIVPAVLLFLPEPPRQDLSQTATANLSNSPDNSSRVPYVIVYLTYGAAILSQMAFYTIPVQIPFYLKNLFQASASQSGLAIAVCTLGSAISSFQYQRIKTKLTFFSIYGIALSTMALGFALISFGGSLAVIALGLASVGLGLGLIMPNMNVCLTSATPVNMRGRVLGGLTTSMFLGQFLSPLASQPLSVAIGLDRTYGLAGIAMVILAIAFIVLLWNWSD